MHLVTAASKFAHATANSVATKRRERNDEGFSLIELLIVTAILPLVVGAISVGVLAVLRIQPELNSRITNSADAQLVSLNYSRDVQSALQITTKPTPVACGAGSFQVLATQWGASHTASYVVTVTSGSKPVYRLFRRVCSSGTVVASYLIANNLPSSQTQATVTCASTVANCNASSGWIPAAGVSGVSLAVAAPGSGQSYLYNLDAQPQSWSPASGGVASGGAAITPFMVLNNGACGTPAVTFTGAAKLVSGTAAQGPAPIAVTSPCASAVTLANSSTTISASIVESGNCPTPHSVTPTIWSPPEECKPLTNPLTALVAPSNPSAGASAGCSGPVTGMTCAAGEYATTPALANTAVIQFGAANQPNQVLIFDQALTIHNSQVATFEPGTYWFKGGLSTSGATSTVLDQGTYLFGIAATAPATNTFTVGNGSVVSSGPGGVLCYLEGGSASFQGGTGSSILGESQNLGVAIWDAVNSPNTTVAITNGAATAANYGGIYVPYGNVTVNGSGAVNVTFVVTNTATFSGSGSLSLG